MSVIADPNLGGSRSWSFCAEGAGAAAAAATAAGSRVAAARGYTCSTTSFSGADLKTVGKSQSVQNSGPDTYVRSWYHAKAVSVTA
jgi:hypothetical protein